MLDRFKAFDGLIFDTCDGSVLLNGLDAVLAGCERFLNLGGSDDFAGACLEIELKAGIGCANNKFSHNSFPFCN